MTLPPLPILAPEPTTDELLGQMQSVLYTRVSQYPDYVWCARARGCELYANGPTYRAAMLKALETKKGIENARRCA